MPSTPAELSLDGAAASAEARGEVWRGIWSSKARTAEEETPLHVLNGYDLFKTVAEWDAFVLPLLQYAGVASGMSVVEAGCGAGAVLSLVTRVHPGVRITGVDYTAALVEVARTRLSGDFHVGNITDLHMLPDHAFDCTLSFGVFPYLDSLDAAARAVQELIRITKPGGCVFIGEISDEAKREVAEGVRAKTHSYGSQEAAGASPTHLYVPKQLIARVAHEAGMCAAFVDHDSPLVNVAYPTAPYRFSAFLRPAAQHRLFLHLPLPLFRRGPLAYVPALRRARAQAPAGTQPFLIVSVVAAATGERDAGSELAEAEAELALSTSRLVDMLLPAAAEPPSAALLEFLGVRVVVAVEEVEGDVARLR